MLLLLVVNSFLPSCGNTQALMPCMYNEQIIGLENPCNTAKEECIAVNVRKGVCDSKCRTQQSQENVGVCR